jgi:ATP-dependent Clp protease ATP-binding subunit ClpA
MLLKNKKKFALYALEDENESNLDNVSALEVFGTDLTLLASKGQLEDCFGREQELLELMEILVRRQKNNPVLVGEAGVGKTAIIELFANKIVNNLVPFVLAGRRIISLDMSRIVAGSKYRGEFELRFQKLINEILAQPNIIIFIDEIHMIAGAGAVEGSMDAANILKPILSRSGFQCIGATTLKEYQVIEKDPALNRRFQPILVKEPTITETVQILNNLRSNLEAFHNVEILPEAMTAAAELSARYITDRFLPDKAIDLLDRAAAKEVIKLTSIKKGSIIRGLVNSSLAHISTLRLEAFRRGEIAAEFIFQEIENAYKNFLLRWLESPTSISEEIPGNLSPISKNFFNNMKLSILKHVETLLFASSKNKINLLSKRNTNNFTFNKNFKLYTKFIENLNTYKTSKFTEFSCIISLFSAWKKNNKSNKTVIKAFYNYLHLQANTAEKRNNLFKTKINNFEKTYNNLSNLENAQVKSFKHYLAQVKPLIQRGLIESLKESSQLNLSAQETDLIYNLLGYYSEASFINLENDLKNYKKLNKTTEISTIKKQITQVEIRDLISHMTGIPLYSVSNSESQKLLNLELNLHKRVVGQEEAISAIAKAIRRSRLGIQNPNRPLASFFFCGPTGVGKTEITKALTQIMFGSEKNMIRFDMSEFMEKFTLSRLIGAPPGYIGYEEGGQLTEAVRRKPYSVVLFDEIEKAHPDVLNILLQILEDGRLTDNKKRVIQFENTMIIMTSNAAAEEIQNIVKLQIQNDDNDLNKISANENLEESNKHYSDPYAGAINFLKSPITENFLNDIKKELKAEFKNSFKESKTYTFSNTTKELEIKTQKIELNKRLKDAVLARLSTLFLPEFLNRLDDIIIFQPLRLEELYKIFDIMLNTLINRLAEKQIKLIVDSAVKNKICREGYNPAFGARPVRRLLTKYIEDLITEDFLKNPVLNNFKEIKIVLNEDNQIIIKNNK